MRWLESERPAEPARLAICHGDFHPHNVLSDGGRVTGVLDWPNALVADPAFDVASTRVILRFAPVELAGVSRPVRVLMRVGRVLLARRYVAGYRRRRPLDPKVLAYYEAASIMRALVRTAEARGRTDAPANLLDASRFADELAAHFARITGIRPGLPPR
jgi:aminoglycoside phosphotransferase (APT) family kinase protein